MATDSVEKLSRVVDRALRDSAYAERIFKEPDAIAAENGLSANEILVVKQMSREQFEIARADAARATRDTKASTTGELSDKDLTGVAGGAGFSSQVLGTAARMIIGRSIICATGGSYSGIGAECKCCGWAGKINIGALVLPADR